MPSVHGRIRTELRDPAPIVIPIGQISLTYTHPESLLRTQRVRPRSDHSVERRCSASGDIRIDRKDDNGRRHYGELIQKESPKTVAAFHLL